MKNQKQRSQQQKVDHRLLGHFNMLKFFDGLGSNQQSLEDVEDMMNSLEEKHLPAKTRQHLKMVCAQKGSDKYKTALQGAISNFKGAAGEILCNADAIQRGDKNVKRGEKISRQKREQYDMALKKPESGGDYESQDALHKTDKLTQTKWYSIPNKTIYLNDISTTLVDGLNWPICEIWTNAEKVDSDIAKKKNITVISRLSLQRRFTKEHLSNIKNIIKGSVVEPPKPLSPLWYQKVAIRACLKFFKKFNRGQLHVPCAWGKTLTGLWVSEGLGSKKTLVLCPSKDLCRQIFAAWLENGKKKGVKRIVVCSDETVTHDAIVAYEDELDFVVVKDVDKLKELTQDCDEYQIISTYQSIKKIIDADLSFDFGFFDEAHRTTQLNDHLFALGLFDANVKIKKRLFATATRRFVHSKNSRCNTMQDESVYGPVFHHMSFAEAVNTGRSHKDDPIKVISPVKVVTNKITNEDLDRELIKRGVTRVGWDLTQTRMVACIIGFLKAVDGLNLKKSFIYTNTVASAERLAGNTINSISQFTKKIKTFHVNGSMRSLARKREFTSFLQAEYSTMTNARCLNEGVDCPTVDCVAFFNPRKSVIDIVQSVGRAMRTDKNNPDKVGYIYVPIFEDVEENTDEALYDSPYEILVDVLRAMASHDESLQDLLNKWLEDVGGGGGGDFPDAFGVVDGDNVDLEELKNNIVNQVMSIFTSKKYSLWRQQIGRAKEVIEKYGHPNFHTILDSMNTFADDPLITPNYKSWVKNTVGRPELLSKNRLEEVTELGFELEPQVLKWKIGVKLLANISKNYCTHNWGNQIDWDRAEKDFLEQEDNWAEGWLKSPEDFQKYKGSHKSFIACEVRKYQNTINNKPRKKNRLATPISGTHHDQWQIDYLKDIPWTPILPSEQCEDEVIATLKKLLIEDEKADNRGGLRWDWNNSRNKSIIRAEEKTGKIVIPAHFEYDGLSVGNAVGKRIIKLHSSGDSFYDKLLKKTAHRMEDLGILMTDEDTKFWVWKQNLKNWEQVRNGESTSDEDKLFAESFYTTTMADIIGEKLTNEKEKLLKKAKFSRKRLDRKSKRQKDLDALIEMGKILGRNISRMTGVVKNQEAAEPEYAEGITKEMFLAKSNISKAFLNGKLSEEEISLIEEAIPHWVWPDKSKVTPERDKDNEVTPEQSEDNKDRLFLDKVKLCKIWFDENPEERWMPKDAIVDNPFPYSLNSLCKDSSKYNIGNFLHRLRQSCQNEQGKMLDKELGKIWRLTRRKAPLQFKLRYRKASGTNSEHWQIALRQGKSPVSINFLDESEGEKGLKILQKRYDENPEIDLKKLKEDYMKESGKVTRKIWSIQEDDAIRENYTQMSDEQIGKILNVSESCIGARRIKLGLKKYGTEEYKLLSHKKGHHKRK